MALWCQLRFLKAPLTNSLGEVDKAKVMAKQFSVPKSR